MVSFLYREDYYEQTSGKQSTVEIILAKQRSGPTGTVELAFDKAYGRFRDLKESEQD